MPLVSVIIPTFNRHDFVNNAVRSVCSQTFSDWECWVVDDGSEKPIELYDIQDPRVQVIRQEQNLGVALARNLGAVKASGVYLAFLDSDDYWMPEKLASQVALAKSGWQLLQCREQWIRRGRTVKVLQRHAPEEGWLLKRSLEDICLSPSSIFIERELFWSLGGFREEYPVCEDFEFALRATAQAPVGLCLERLTVKQAGHDFQLSHRYLGLDFYRISALLSFRLFQPLEWELQDDWRESVSRKMNIILRGAQQHKRLELASKITECLDLLSYSPPQKLYEDWNKVLDCWGTVIRNKAAGTIKGPPHLL